MSFEFQISSFYKFFPLEESALAAAKVQLEEFAEASDLGGLIIAASEGLNGSVCGTVESVSRFERLLGGIFDADDWEFKKAPAAKRAFKHFNVQVRPEIVSSHTELSPLYDGDPATYLAPEEWQKLINSPDVIVLDTRNDYELKIGKFQNAVDLKLDAFSEFPEKLKESGLPKDKTILTYCTGGIRCEKAVLEMKRQGYQHVFQLHGGILKYLERFPNQDFAGECFVFDNRVAVDQSLHPTTRYSFCPHCGDAADEPLTCTYCGSSARVCSTCRTLPSKNTCSHNCAYHTTRLS